MKKSGLGRGLDSLFSENSSDSDNITSLNIDFVFPDENQHRKSFSEESIRELADSISVHGLLQPILVRLMPDGTYRIIAGERRYRASRIAGLSEVPVIIKDLSDKDAMAVALIENLQREDLNPVDEANGYNRLIEEFELTQEEAARQVGKSRAAVTNSLRLLKLPDIVIEELKAGSISAGHARALLAVEDSEKIIDALDMILLRSLSVRETEKLVKSINSGELGSEEKDKTSENVFESYMKTLGNKVEARLGRKIKISCKDGKNNGKLTLSFSDSDDLEKIITTLCGEDIFLND